MAGRHEAGAEPLGARGERGELQIAVAVHARNRRAAVRVLPHEVRHDGLVELPLEIDDVVGDAQLAGDAAGIVQIVDRAAGAETHLAIGVRSGVIVQLHREADDLVPLTSEQCGGDRRIDAAGHGDNYTHFLSGGLRPAGPPYAIARGGPMLRSAPAGAPCGTLEA